MLRHIVLVLLIALGTNQSNVSAASVCHSFCIKEVGNRVSCSELKTYGSSCPQWEPKHHAVCAKKYGAGTRSTGSSNYGRISKKHKLCNAVLGGEASSAPPSFLGLWSCKGSFTQLRPFEKINCDITLNLTKKLSAKKYSGGESSVCKSKAGTTLVTWNVTYTFNGSNVAIHRQFSAGSVQSTSHSEKARYSDKTIYSIGSPTAADENSSNTQWRCIK